MFKYDTLNTEELIEKYESPIITSKHKWSSDPVPDFWERLPEKIIDPRTKKEVKLSQSLIKNFIKHIEGELCGLRFYRTTVTREFEEHFAAAKFGHRFEFLVTGEPGRNGEGQKPFVNVSKKKATKKQIEEGSPEYIVTEKPSAQELRIRADASVAKEVLEQFNGKRWKSGVKVSIKSLEGTKDVVSNRKNYVIVTDLKYSGLLGESWGELSWPDDISDKVSHMTQATHYTLLAEKHYGKRVKFYFLVFSNKKDTSNGVEVFGKYQPYEVRVSEKAMNRHKNMILDLAEQMERKLKGKEFNAIPSFHGCKKCPITTCKKRIDQPEIIVTEI